MLTSGIYRIVNNAAGKLYVGSAKKLSARWSHHIGMLRRGKHDNIHLQRAWNRDGESAFTFEVIIECAAEELVSKEQWWIDFYGIGKLYNIAPKASSMLGFKHSEETKARLRGRKLSAESLAKMRAIALLRDHSNLRLLAAKRRGVSLTPEHRLKLMGRVGPKGIKWSEESRQRSSEKRKGKPIPWLLGYRHSDDVKKAIGEMQIGRKASEETRAKMSEAHKRIWAARRDTAQQH